MHDWPSRPSLSYRTAKERFSLMSRKLCETKLARALAQIAFPIYPILISPTPTLLVTMASSGTQSLRFIALEEH